VNTAFKDPSLFLDQLKNSLDNTITNRLDLDLFSINSTMEMIDTPLVLLNLYLYKRKIW